MTPKLKKKLRKLKPRGVLTREPKTPQEALLIALVNQHDGLQGTAEFLAKKLKLPITKWVVSNWLVRGKVPLLYVHRVAKAFKVSPYALNYFEYTEFTDRSKPWQLAVSTVTCVPAPLRRRIGNMEPVEL